MSGDEQLLLERLGCSADAGVRRLRDGTASYHLLHLGRGDLGVADVLDAVRGLDRIRVPRSGHIGNWNVIANGTAGAMDFNSAICSGGYGYPLIYAFTQTETADGRGDRAYVPGVLIDEDRCRSLQLCSWDGRRFVRRDRTQPWFVPFMLAEDEGQLLPLVSLHAARMPAQYEWAFEASLLMQDEDKLRRCVAALVGSAARARRPERAMSRVFSQKVALDGTVSKAAIRIEGEKYGLDGTEFADLGALVDAAIVPFAAVARPDEVFERIARLPSLVPILSTTAVTVISAMMGTHRRTDDSSTDRDGGAVVVHPHWGARMMAGYPPRESGYMSHQSSIKTMTAMCDALVQHAGAPQALCIVLLPAAIFMLCPSSAYPDDSDAVGRLIGSVLAVGRTDASDPQLQATVDEIAADWIRGAGIHVSRYFADRFKDGAGIPRERSAVPAAHAIEPPGFRNLPMRMACILVSSLRHVIGRRAE